MKAVCRSCEWKGKDEDLLTGLNPFDEDMTITGCPECKCIDTTVMACEEEGCWHKITCAWLDSNKNYHCTCSKHYEQAKSHEPNRLDSKRLYFLE